MIGYGAIAVGSTPFGAGTPDAAVAPPASIPDKARFISSIGEYQLGDDGEFLRMPVLRHRVLVTLSTLLDSSIVDGFGLRLPDRIDERYSQVAEQRIRAALADMVDAGDLRIDAVTVTTETGRAEHIVVYRDLTTGNPDTVTV